MSCQSAGIQLSTDEIGQLLCPSIPYRLRGWLCRGGRGLMGCMHFSDVIMTLTGTSAPSCMNCHKDG